METIKLLERDINGKKNNVLLSEGFVPAVVYNAKQNPKYHVRLYHCKRIAREATSTTILDAELEGKHLKTY